MSGHLWYAEGLVLGTIEGHLEFSAVLVRLRMLTQSWGIAATDQELIQFIRDHADNPATAGISANQRVVEMGKNETAKDNRTSGKRRG
jgi:hypothetical protein